jgi:hypothetical protein
LDFLPVASQRYDPWREPSYGWLPTRTHQLILFGAFTVTMWRAPLLDSVDQIVRLGHVPEL